MATVFSRLAALEIEPEGTPTKEGPDRKRESELRERIIRRAEQLRREWKNTDSPEAAEGKSIAPLFTEESRETAEDRAMKYPDNWFALLCWGKATGNLGPRSQNLCVGIRKCLRDGRELSTDDRRRAKDIWKAALEGGFIPRYLKP